MRQGTALPLTCCSNKGEGHYSFHGCRQRLAWRTNGGLFCVWPHPCRPASPHSTRGGQRRRVCLASPFGGASYCGGWVSFFAAFGSLDEQKSSEMCHFSGLLTGRNIPTPPQACRVGKVLACFPRPAQGSVNPSCVSQIPSVFVRQQRRHLLMTFHVFTGVLPGVGGGGS